MSNGRSIKRKMAKEQEAQGAPMGQEAQRPPSSQGNEGVKHYGSYEDLAKNLDQNAAQDISPEKRKQVEMVQSTLTDMLYHPEGKEALQSMLSGDAPPEQSIPMVVNTVFMKFEDMTTQAGKGQMPIDVKLAGGVHLFSEVIELAEAQGVIPEDLEPEALQPMMMQTFQQYIQRGLKTGSIDPIELQQQIEPLLSGEEKEIGMHFAKSLGTPEEVSEGQAMEGVMRKREAPLKAKLAEAQGQNKEMTQALQGMAAAPPPQEEGQGGQGGMA